MFCRRVFLNVFLFYYFFFIWRPIRERQGEKKTVFFSSVSLRDEKFWRIVMRKKHFCDKKMLSFSINAELLRANDDDSANRFWLKFCEWMNATMRMCPCSRVHISDEWMNTDEWINLLNRVRNISELWTFSPFYCRSWLIQQFQIIYKLTPIHPILKFNTPDNNDWQAQFTPIWLY